MCGGVKAGSRGAWRRGGGRVCPSSPSICPRGKALCSGQLLVEQLPRKSFSPLARGGAARSPLGRAGSPEYPGSPSQDVPRDNLGRPRGGGLCPPCNRKGAEPAPRPAPGDPCSAPPSPARGRAALRTQVCSGPRAVRTQQRGLQPSGHKPAANPRHKPTCRVRCPVPRTHLALVWPGPARSAWAGRPLPLALNSLALAAAAAQGCGVGVAMFPGHFQPPERMWCGWHCGAEGQDPGRGLPAGGAAQGSLLAAGPCSALGPGAGPTDGSWALRPAPPQGPGGAAQEPPSPPLFPPPCIPAAWL